MAPRLDDPAATLREFRAVVNMAPAALEKWLATHESRAVGIERTQGVEPAGPHSDRRILELLDKDEADLGESDLAHMRKVVGYVHRNLAQRPSGDVRNTRWRWSLMNWGHDPLEP